MMMWVVLAMLAAGLLLLFGAPWIARAALRGRDPGGLTRILQGLGLVLVVASFLLAPRSPETSAFPPPPDAPPMGER